LRSYIGNNITQHNNRLQTDRQAARFTASFPWQPG